MLTLEHPVATLSPSGSYSTAETSHGAQIVDRIAHRANATQIDLLVRLRIIERLQGLSHPRAQYPQAEEAILPVLNWLASCFVCGSAARVVAVALSSQRGLVTAYIASHGDEATNQGALTEAVNVFKTALRNVLSDDRVTPELATKTFLRLLLATAYPKIFRKIVLVGRSGGEPGETTYHFGTIVHAWLTYRSEGEMSRGFVSMALNPDPTSDASDSPRHATDYMIQSLLTVVHPKHRDSDGLTQEGRHMYLSYIITACTLLEKSTFFNDVVNDTAFRAALRITDRMFLQKLYRRISRVAAYKSGAVQFAFYGIPYLQRVLGPCGIADFLGGTGGIQVHFVPKPPPKVLRWPFSPREHLHTVLGIDTDIVDQLQEHDQFAYDSLHSRRNTDGSGTSRSTNSHSRQSTGSSIDTATTESSSASAGSFGARSLQSELSHLDNQLRSELLNSELLTSAWVKGEAVRTTCHAEVQLVHYLEERNVDVTSQAIGTSKPACWACALYIERMGLRTQDKEKGREPGDSSERQGGVSQEGGENGTRSRSDDDGDEEEPGWTPARWCHSRGLGKVYEDWMIPPSAPPEVVDTVLEEAHRAMERLIEEVAFDL